MVTEFARQDSIQKEWQRSHPARCLSCLKLRQYNGEQGMNLFWSRFLHGISPNEIWSQRANLY